MEPGFGESRCGLSATRHLRERDVRLRLDALGEILATGAELWRAHGPPEGDDWRARFPAERRFVDAARFDRSAILGLDLARVRAAEIPNAVVRTGRDVDRLSALCDLPGGELDLGRELDRGASARKRAQIERFARVVAGALGDDGGAIVDCCAGKAHLGRALAYATGRAVVSVDRDPALCREADALAQRSGVPLRSRCVDVRSSSFARDFVPGSTAVALHACGDLHREILRCVGPRGARTAIVAPCCYFRTRDLPARALSSAGRRSGLRFDRADLQFATCRATIASPRARARVATKQAWYFGIRDWWRRCLPESEIPLQRTIRRAWIAEGFTAVARHLATAAGVPPPSVAELAPYEAVGWERLRRALAYERVRDPWRRALEAWLFLDRVTWLIERGLRVRAGIFCSEGVTPRNRAMIADAPSPVVFPRLQRS